MNDWVSVDHSASPKARENDTRQKVARKDFAQMIKRAGANFLPGNASLWLRLSALPVLRRWLGVEEERLALFVPVFFAVGIGLYFSLATEPAFMPALMVMVATLIAPRYAGSTMAIMRLFIAIISIVTAGFVTAKIRTFIVMAPILEREIDFADVEGKIVRVEHRSNGWRVIVEPSFIEGLAKDQTPKRIRLSWRGKNFEAHAGDVIALRAGLSPPPPPAIPGGYDFGRHLYFQKIGAVGYAVSSPTIMSRALPSGWIARVGTVMPVVVETMRKNIFTRILNATNSEGGTIVAAIVTGKREAIPPDAEAALRDSGLAHLLAISGLHMGLATGLIFFGVRFLLTLNTRFALSKPIKKWAALAALASGFAYLVISGSGWSARRAFIMSSIIFVAMLTDRRALSLRNVAVAAMIILIFTPEALLHPGFQMSFAAVTALIAAYEWGTDYNRRKIETGATIKGIDHYSWWQRFRRYAVGIAGTDTIAAIATAPFALYHFHRTAIYSLPANIIAMPLMGLWIMPMVIVALLVMPIGLDGFFWRLAASGIDAILFTGRSVSDLPGATSLIPSQSSFWLLILCFGGVILCLLKAPWRLTGLVAVPLAIMIMIITPKPTLMISGDGQNAGVLVNHEGREQLAVFDRRRGRFTTGVWMESLGFDGDQQKPLVMRDVMPCDPEGCVITLGGRVAAISSHPISLAQDCSGADIVVALYPVNRRLAPECRALLLDRRGAWEDGARSLWVQGNGSITVRAVTGRGRDRPWR